MLKKAFVFIVFIFMIYVGSINVLAADCTGYEKNYTSNNITTNYDCETKTLNIQYDNDLKSMININSKINHQEIAKYLITDHDFYLLTDDNKIFNAKYTVERNTINLRGFRQLNYYKANKYLIIDFSANKYGTIVYFKTNNKNVSYYLSTISSCYPQAKDWRQDVKQNYMLGSKNVLIYKEIKNDTIYEAAINNKQQLIYFYSFNDKKGLYTVKKYRNNKLNSYAKYSKYKDSYAKYNSSGTRIQLNIKRYKAYKTKTFKNWRLPLKENIYTYNSAEKLTKRVSYRFKNKSATKQTRYKLQVREYKRNKKDQLKSNKYGKAHVYVTKYNNGKAHRTYKVKYNSQGKWANKTIVKLRK
ncbi:hypothetical protein LJB88_02820 [Erysipelotrichaceae bacterium OttesenSCG-928-M19]|nr:hypothetical protein [Erysipelotrichaceae bacterium OttesenSCG-928-M19]